MKALPLTSRATLALGLGRILIKNVQGGLTTYPSFKRTAFGRR